MLPNKKNNQFNAFGLRQRGDRFIRITVIVLITLLPVMAFFQYKWLGQLSEAETVRTRTNLQISADRFSEDFDRQLTLIYQTFQIEIEAAGKKNVIPFLVDRYRQLAQTVNADSLVDAIYYLPLEMKKKPDLYRLDIRQATASRSEWPASLLFIRNAVRFDNDENIMRLIQFTQTPWLGKVPIIITSDSPPMLFDSKRMDEFRLVIIVLNQEYFNNRLIPSLINTHFGVYEDLELDIAIARKGEPDSLYYKSGSTSDPADFSNVDVRADLGRWRMRGIFIATAVTKTEREDIQKLTRDIDNTEISLKVITQDSVDKKEISRYLISKVPGWELLVRHHSGSLEAAIAETHRRNLLISFGILALLGVSIVMVYLSSQRAKKLAGQQMEFVAGVSHELRTPLSVIRSAGENLADGVIRDPEQTHRYGRLIRDEGRRLSDLVEQVLTFSGIRNGAQNLNKQRCNINTLIGEVLAQIHENGPTIETRFQENMPDILCDRTGIQMVLKNIISNAIKYSGKSVCIQITTDSDKSKGFLSIRICDNGMGIEADDLNRIFEPFYRSRSAIEAQIHGTGLGLSLAQKIIELHHGKISARSNTTQGTCFEISLPIEEASS